MYTIDVSVLFTGDNVDHNIVTIDGKGTFHGMGIIAALAPRKQLGIVVPRKQVAELHVKEHAAIGIMDYRFSNHARQSVEFLDLPKSPEDRKWDRSVMGIVIQFPEASTQWSEKDAHSSPRPSTSKEFIHHYSPND